MYFNRYIPRGIIYHSLIFDFLNIFKAIFSKIRSYDEVEKFEKTFASYNNSKYCVAFPFARMGIFYSLKCHDFQKGSEIIMPPITIKAILDVVLKAGLKPVFVDIEMDTFSFDMNDLANKVTNNTKAILITYLYGMVPDLNQLISFAKDKKLLILEDFSQCLNGEFEGIKTGNFGDIGIYSSSTTKTLDTYGGGLCVTDNKKLYKELKRYQNEQKEPNRVVLIKKVVQDFLRNLFTNITVFNLVTVWLIKIISLFNNDVLSKFVGDRSTEKMNEFPSEYYYKFTSFQAKVGLETIKDVETYDTKRIANVNYVNGKSSLDKQMDIQNQRNTVKNVFWQLLIPFSSHSQNEITDIFKEFRVDTARTSLPLLPELQAYNFTDSTPVAKEIISKGYFIPTYHKLKSKDLDRITKLIKKASE